MEIRLEGRGQSGQANEGKPGPCKGGGGVLSARREGGRGESEDLANAQLEPP